MPRDPTNWQTYLVTQESASNGRRTPEIVGRALEGGIDVVQLREKGLDARDRYEVGRVVRTLTAEADVPLIVNDRIDLARALGADGVHVGQSDLPVAVARDLLGESAIVGCSASTVEEALEAERAGASYLGVGAIYGTPSKSVAAKKDGIGTERIEAIVDAVDIPVIGIGGITAENARAVVDAGGTGVAVISEISGADDPTGATETLVERVDGEEQPSP